LFIKGFTKQKEDSHSWWSYC